MTKASLDSQTRIPEVSFNHNSIPFPAQFQSFISLEKARSYTNVSCERCQILIEFSFSLTIIVAIALPIFALCLVFLIEPWFRISNPKRARRYLSYIFHPPSVFPLKSAEAILAPDEKRAYLKTQFLKRLGLFYLLLALFLISSFWAEFYYILGDLTQPITQGGTDLTRVWTSVQINDPFYGGWKGSLPWYGIFLLPALEANTFHEPWNWRFFTTAISVNPEFFGDSFARMLVAALAIGAIFLLPLLLKTLRRAFVPSLFFYMTGMLIITKSFFACLGQSLRILIGGESITYGLITVTSATDHLSSYAMMAIGVCLPIVVVMFLIFLKLGQKLWTVHYDNSSGTMKWFLISVTMAFWGNLLFSVVVI
jgi:hypothetical protein